MRKRVFSILLSIAVCLSMMPVGAWADVAGEGGTATQSNNVAEVTIGETVTQYADIDAAFTAAQEADSAEVKLLNNVTMTKEYSYGIELKKGNITLNLNGFSLSTTDYESFVPRGAIFCIDGGNLTINDSGGGSGKIVEPNAGPAVYVYKESTLIINSGTIENTSEKEPKKDVYKCAVFVSGGDVTVNGGTIGTVGSAGDGLSYREGTAILNGGMFKKVEIIKKRYGSDINQNVTVSNLLGAGRSYRYADESSPDSYDVDALDNVSVVEGKIPIKYQRYDESFVFKSASVDTYTDVTAETTAWTEGVYVVTGNVNITGEVTVTGKTELILRDGASLTVKGCLSLASKEESKGLTIYGQSDQTGTMSIINNDGYALNFSDGTGNVNLYVYGGSFSAKGSQYAISNNNTGISVVMSAATGWKYVADGSAVTDGFKFSNKNSVAVEKCIEHEWGYYYIDESGTNTHYKYCRLCDFSSGNEAHKVSRYECADNSKHTEYCVCGKEIGTAEHETEVVVNDDGLTHKTACKFCSYAAENETHTFENGSCTGCGAELAAEYDGRKYASLQKAIDDAAKAEDGTVTLAADEIAENVTVTGDDIIIDLNGKKWIADITTDSLCIPLTVDGGSVTLKNGKIYQSKSGSSARSAIVVKSGSLAVEGDVSVMGGTSGIEAVRCYSVDMQGGSLTLKQGAALLTGMKVPDGHTLSEYLPAGSAFVKCEYTDEGGVQIPDAEDYVTEVYTASEYTGAMAVAAHTHKGISCACGFVCDHSAIDEDGYCSQCQMTFEAKNDSTYYESLATAISEAKDGETVTLLKNNVMSADITLGGNKAVKLDVNSKGIDSEGETLQSIIIESGATLSVSNTKTGTLPTNGKPLDITFEVKSGGMLDLCPDGYVITSTYRGTVSCVKLAGGGKLRSFGGIISNLELTEPYQDYDVNIMRSTSDCAKINRISSESATLTVGDVLEKNHTGYVLYGRNSGTWETVPNTTLIKDMKDWTGLYVTQCDHGDADADAVCDYCGAALVVKVEARKGNTGVVSIKYFALVHEPISKRSGYAVAISTMNGTLNQANGYTYREMTLLCDADNLPDLSGDFTLEGNGKSINGKVNVRSGASIIFSKGFYKGNVDISGSATVNGSTTFSGGSVTVWSSGVMITETNSTITSPVTVKGKLNINGGYLSNVTFSEGSSGIIKGGSFASLKIDEKRTLDTLLADGYAYHDFDTSKVVNGVVTSLSRVRIMEHTHKFTGSNPCACGYTCEHDIDGSGVCSKCKTQFAATVTTGSDIEYVTDIYDAFAAAGSGSTIKLLADTSLDKSFEFTTGDVTLDLNGKALTVYAGRTVTVSDGSKVKLTDSVGTGSMTSIAANGGELNITGGNVTKLDVKKAENISISGGSFDSIVNSTGTYFYLGVLLADGYAFKQGETFKKQDETVSTGKTVENLTIAQCVDGEHYSKYSPDGNICAYCNKKIVAGIGTAVIKYYADLGNAIADADCDKYRAVTISRDITLDKPIIISKLNNSMNTLYIDLQNHKISSGTGFSGSMFTVTDGYIAFRGGSIEAADTDGITVTGGSLEVESGSVSASGAGCAAIRLKGGKLEISTGSVASSGDAYAIFAESGDELFIKADQSFGKLKIADTYDGSMRLKAQVPTAV